MGIEIERKYLVTGDDWRNLDHGVHYRQGYLHNTAACTVRVRTDEHTGYLTIKGASKGATRMEYEYPIPVADAAALLDDFCERPLIEKKRYTIPFEGLVWVVDEFFGANDGLIVAEVELASEDQTVTPPPWIGAEVTDDPRYYNANLIRKPYTTW